MGIQWETLYQLRGELFLASPSVLLMRTKFENLRKKAFSLDPIIREEVAESLGTINKKASVLLLEQLLSDSNYNVRCEAICSLKEISPIQSVHKVAQCLEDEDELVRINAAEYLGNSGSKSMTKLLLEKLNDTSELVRSYAATALGQIGQKETIPKIRKRLSKEKSELAKVGLLEALYLLGIGSSMNVLISLLGSRNYQVRCSVVNTLCSHITPKNLRRIRIALVSTLRKEKATAVKSTIQSRLKEVDSQHNETL